MLPVLLDFKFVKIYTMGVFLVLAFFWASFVLWRLIRLSSYKEEDIFDALFNSIFGGLFMGRLVYVILNFKDFGFSPLKFLLVNGYPGFSLYGILLGVFGVLYFWAAIKKEKFRDMIDYFIPPALLALAIGKLGSFFSGSEVGTKTRLFLAARYASMDGMRQLTPLYEAVLFFLFAYLSYRILFEIRKDHLKKGFNLNLFLWAQGFVYFIFDNLKQYHLYFLNYSFNQIVSFVLLLTFSFYFVYYFRSLLFGRVSVFKNSLVNYGQRHIQSIRSKSKKDDRGGGKKNSSADRKPEKG